MYLSVAQITSNKIGAIYHFPIYFTLRLTILLILYSLIFIYVNVGTYNAVHSERQVIGHNATQVCAQAVAHARELVHVQTSGSQMRQHNSHTPGHGLEIVNRGRITRDRREFAPVHHEHIVLSVVQIRCKSDDLKKYIFKIFSPNFSRLLDY